MVFRKTAARIFSVRCGAQLRDSCINAIRNGRMRVSCPSCQTEYEVPDAALAGRTRRLKCAQCGNQWQVGALSPGPAAPPPPPPVVPPLPPLSELAYLQRPRPGAASSAAAATQAAEPPAPAYEEPPPQEVSYPPPVPARVPARVPRNDPQTERDSFATLVEAARQTSSEAEARRAQRERRQQASPWLISVLLLLLAIAVIWLERNHIMHIWPPSTRLFEAIGRLIK